MRFATLVGTRERPRLDFTVPAGGDLSELLRTIDGIDVDDDYGTMQRDRPHDTDARGD